MLNLNSVKRSLKFNDSKCFYLKYCEYDVGMIGCTKLKNKQVSSKMVLSVTQDYTSSNNWMTANDLERMWKEAIMP
jgi:hypothetical protein